MSTNSTGRPGPDMWAALADKAPWIDRFAGDGRELAGILLIVTTFWMLVSVLRRGKVLRRSLPTFVPWLIDLLLLPATTLVGSALLRALLRDAGYGFLDAYVRSASLLLVYLLAAWLVARGVDLWFTDDATTAASARRGATRLLRGLTYTAALVVGGTVFMAAEGYSVTGVLVSTGIAAAVLSLALQNTLSDLFSGIALSIEQPARVGDWIMLEDGTAGRIVDITWRSVWLTSWTNTRIVVPNSKLTGQKFENLAEPTAPYSPWYLVRVPADLPPPYATMLLREAVLRCKHVLREPAPVIRLADATTIPYTYLVWVTFENYPAMFRGREEVFREIDAALRAVDVEPAPDIGEFRTRESRMASVTAPTVATALRTVDVLKGLDDAQLDELSTFSRHIEVEAGDTLIREGAVPEAMYAIVAGVLQASVSAPDGRRIATERLVPGQAVGQVALLTGEPSYMTVSAATDCNLVEIGLEGMRKVVARNPEIGDRIARTVADRIAETNQARSRAVRRIDRHLSLREVRARLERLLRGRP